MAVRSVLVLLATAGLVTSLSAVAVGLGELRLQSTINQPLSAEIELLSVEGHEAGQLRARLGSADDFARAGLERSHVLTGLAFRPVLDAVGGPVLKVTSNQSVREPFLDFLVRLEWPDGQLLRAYTVLLDLPEQGVQPPLASRSGPATFDDRQPARRSSGVSPLRRPAITPGSHRYTVRSGDTLWNVASRARPQGATVQQTLMAIYRENPDAFIDGDMNRMRRDYPLRVPEPSEVAAIDADDARATVWREAGEGLSTALVMDTTVAESSDIVNETVSGQLRLATPQPDTPSAGASMDGTSVGSTGVDGSTDAPASAAADASDSSAGGSSEWFSQDSSETSSETFSATSSGSEGAGTAGAIAATNAVEKILYLEEEVLLTRRENRELHERIDNLEEQLGVMSRLVELQSDTVTASQLHEAAQLDETTVTEVAVADSNLFGKLATGGLVAGGLAILLLGGMVVRKRRHQQRDELVAPGLFMTHHDAGAATPASALEVPAVDEPAVDEPEDTSEATGEFEGDLSWEEPSAIEEPSASEEPSAIEEPSASEKPSAIKKPGDDSNMNESIEYALESELALDLDLNEFDLTAWEGESEGSATNSGLGAALIDTEVFSNAEEPAATDEVSLEQWFAELAEESPSGQNNGADLAEVKDGGDQAAVGTGVAGDSDYRIATRFDLDFSAFSDANDALAQRDPLHTRLELARVYIDMQDSQSAKEILEELVMATDAEVQRDARELLHSLE